MLASHNHRRPFFSRLRRNNRGQTAFEYVMLIVLVAVAAFITSPSMTDSILRVISGTSKMLEDGMSSGDNPAGVPERPPTDNTQ